MEFVIALLFSLFSVFTFVKLMIRKKPLDLIPGPSKLPLIGNLHLLTGNNSPLHHVFRDMAIKYGPLMHIRTGEISFLVISSVQVAEQVLKTHGRAFADRPDAGILAKAMTYNFTNIALSPYGEYWRRLRRICAAELFSARRVRSFRPIREEENLNLCKWIASVEGSPVNLSERVYLSAFDVITRVSVGGDCEYRESVMAAIKEVMKLSSSSTIADIFPSLKLITLFGGIRGKMERVFRRADRIYNGVIEQHRVANATESGGGSTDKTEDMLDVLLRCRDLTIDNIKAVIMDMFLGGVETSQIVVEWAMPELMQNSIALKRAQGEVTRVFDKKGYVDEVEFDELPYLKSVIKEALRLHPPLPLLFPRESSQRCEINGYEVPPKTRVMINAWALGRDPEHWDEADRFIPERFLDSRVDYKGNNFEYIPFGSGRRICPGISLGVANVEFTLAMLLYHFDWGLPDGIKNEELDMTEGFGFSNKRKHDLVLVPTVRRALQAAK